MGVMMNIIPVSIYQDQENYIIGWLSKKTSIAKEELKKSFDLSIPNLLALNELIGFHKVHNNRYAIQMHSNLKNLQFIEEKHLRYFTPNKINKSVPIFEHIGIYPILNLNNYMLNLDNNIKFVFIWDFNSGELYQVVTGLNYVEYNTILFHGVNGGSALKNKAFPYNPQVHHKGPLALYLQEKDGNLHSLNHKSNPRPDMKKINPIKLDGKVYIIIKEVNEKVKGTEIKSKKAEDLPINTVAYFQQPISFATRFTNR